MRERLFSQTEANSKVIFFKSSCATLSIHVKDNIFQGWSLCGLVPHLDNGTTKSPQQARGALGGNTDYQAHSMSRSAQGTK